MALTFADIAVNNIVPEVQQDLSGQVREFERIYYTIADKGPWSVLIPRVDFRADVVLQKVREDARARLEVMNLDFSQG